MYVDKLLDLHKELAQDIAFLAIRSAKYYNSKRLKRLTFKKGDKVYLLRRNLKIKKPSKKLNHIKIRLF